MKTFKTTIKHIRRTPYQALAAILLATLTFFVISLFSLANLGLNSLLGYFESTPQVTAFFQSSAKQQDIQRLKTKLEATGLVKSMTYISQEQALEIYRRQNQDNPLLLEMVTADILPASLEVAANDIQDLAKIADLMKQDPQVEEVVYQQDIINSLQKWTKGIRLGSLVFSALFFVISLITFTVIIGLKIANRREEINTLSLLGATSWYIRAPFLLEGILYGLIGSVLGWGFVYTGLLYLSPNLNDFFQGVIQFPVSHQLMLIILGFQSILAFILGWFSAVLASYRYGK